MAINLSYMGTKRALAGEIAEVVVNLKAGPVLDVFAGMCSVGTYVGTSRQVWLNDAQRFSHLVAKMFFCDPNTPANYEKIGEKFIKHFEFNKNILQGFFDRMLKNERMVFKTGSVIENEKLQTQQYEYCTSEKAQYDQKELRVLGVYCLLSTSYQGSYIGLEQSIEVDSIRYAIDQMYNDGEINESTRNWMIIALCQSLSRVSLSPGHFAQFLKIKPSNFNRSIRQRTRVVLKEWRLSYESLWPLGSPKWRKNNRSWNVDTLDIQKTLSESKNFPAVVYADPPYTSDQFSRYYHLHETMIDYDYPTVLGRGRYPKKRFQSQFSIKSTAKEAISSLIHQVRSIGSDLVLSYPEKGIFPNSKSTIEEIIKDHYGKKMSIVELEHKHSTMGASKGQASSDVTEYLFVGRC